MMHDRPNEPDAIEVTPSLFDGLFDGLSSRPSQFLT